MTDLNNMFMRPNNPNAPLPQATPDLHVEKVAAPQYTPAGWQGDKTPVHGYPMPTPPAELPQAPEAKWGRYTLPHPETGNSTKFSRATTLAGSLDDKAGVAKWVQRNIVLGLKRDPDLLDDVDLFGEPRDVNRDLDKLIDSAGELAGAKEASERGTAIHAWTEAVERDGVELDQVPADFRPTVKAYLDELDKAGITTVPGMVERLVWNRHTGHVGTLDRIYELADGTRVIGDVKTSKTTSLKYGHLSFAMQTYIYATADAMYNPATGEWENMPPVGDVFSVIAHIPSDKPGTCELLTLDLAQGAQGVNMALALKDLRDNAGKTIPNQWPIPTPAPSDDLNTLIDQANSQADLAALWETHKDKWTDAHTQRGMARLRG